jgi:hypothetical protein
MYFEVLLVALVVASTAVAGDQAKSFVNSKFGYKMMVPAKWDMDLSGSGVPVLFNYKRSEGGPQGLFPEHGAHLFIVPLTVVQPMANAKRIDEWIQFNLRTSHEDPLIRQVPDLDPGEGGPRNIVEVQADFIRDEQDGERQREFNYYFTLRNTAFRLMLLYWKSNPQGRSFQSTAEDVLRSIKATSTAP